MDSRLNLQYLLEDIIGSENVYFQPPESVKMKYPAIVYKLDRIVSLYAGNDVYISYDYYSVVVIDANPDSEIVHEVASLSTSKFERHYTSENLNHWSFSLYF